MATEILRFEDAIQAANNLGNSHALLGNGFSRDCKNDIFSYDALFERADFSHMSKHCKDAFDTLKTSDFEYVIKALTDASRLINVYEKESLAIGSVMKEDALLLREVLVRTIAESHPAHPAEISDFSYSACREFLSKFKKIYTLNYDLLLYWAYMQKELGPDLELDDGFRHPDQPQDYVTWEVENTFSQDLYYLHGALHLFDNGFELQKYTWCNTGIKLIDQIREALSLSKYPLFVSEGTSKDKLKKIKHSGYLHRGLASITKIKGSLFMHGLSFDKNDDHIINAVVKGEIENIYVSIFGNPGDKNNLKIISRANEISVRRNLRNSAKKKAKSLSVKFYDASSANVWGKNFK